MPVLDFSTPAVTAEAAEVWSSSLLKKILKKKDKKKKRKKKSRIQYTPDIPEPSGSIY